MIEDIPIGIYELGYDNVQLYITTGRSGSFVLTNPEKTIPYIKLGGAYAKWSDFYAIALHEAMEFALTRGNLRFTGSQDLGCSSGSYIFILNHAQFSDCCAKAAEFLAEAYKDLKLAWIRFKIKNRIKDNTMEEVF